MAKKNVQQSIEKWKKNTAAAGEAMKAGIQAVTESPTAKAADAADKYARNVQESVDSGRYQAACRAVSTGEWKEAASGKGVVNMQNGVRNLSARAMRNQADQLAYAQQVADQIASMPRETREDMRARMLRAMELMEEFKKNG